MSRGWRSAVFAAFVLLVGVDGLCAQGTEGLDKQVLRPKDNNLTVVFSPPTQGAELVLRDASGRVIDRSKAAKLTAFTYNLPAGKYTVHGPNGATQVLIGSKNPVVVPFGGSVTPEQINSLLSGKVDQLTKDIQPSGNDLYFSVEQGGTDDHGPGAPQRR